MHNLVLQALDLAFTFHNGQTDKVGEPYVLHPIRVMLKMRTMDEQIVALLHDLIEDTILELRHLNFPSRIVEAVDAITKRKGETNLSYLARVNSNPLARAVKIADIKDNLSEHRLNRLHPSTKERLVRKYNGALELLGK